MPFATPHSTLLDEMARRRAEYEALGERMAAASQQGVGALQGMQAEQQAAAALADKREAAAADLALRQKAEARMGQESALRQRAQAVEQAQAQAREAREAQGSALQRKIDEQAAADAQSRAAREAVAAQRKEGRGMALDVARGVGGADFSGAEDFDQMIAKAAEQSGLSPEEVRGMVEADMARQREANRKEAAAARAVTTARGGGSRQRAPKAVGGGGAPQGKDPEIGIVTRVADYDAQIDALAEIAKTKGKVNTGFFATPAQSALERFGLASEEFTQVKADTANVINNIISQLSGANVPESEMARLLNGLPDPGDDDNVFTTKLNAKLRQLQDARKYLVGAAGAAGRDVSGFGSAAPSPAAAAAFAATVPDDDRW